MCIILYKPVGIPMPQNSILENCFDNNPDGVGFMYQDNNSNNIIIQKGFMDYYSFFDALTELNNRIDTTTNSLVFHFRYATQGSVSPGNCHPFPITAKVKQLQQTTIKVNTGIVHNGVIPFCSTYSKNNKLSDTQIFIRDYLSKMNNSTLFNPAVLSLIKESTNSKFIFMDVKHIELIGNFIEDHGIYYSNNTYKIPRWYKLLKSKKQVQKHTITDYCVYCGKLKLINDYNGLCSTCEKSIEV